MIISICNQKGGVAKTTTSINLASNLAELGKKVLVVDLDPQYNLTVGLDFDNTDKKTTFDLLKYEEVNIKDTIYKTDFNLDIIPSCLTLANLEVELSTVMYREELLKDKLETIKDDYDYIIIDCNPALGILTLNGLVASDKVIVAIEPGSFALEGITNLGNFIKKIQRKLNPSLEMMGVLLTRVIKNTNISKTFKGELGSIFGDKFFKTIIHTNVTIADSQMNGKPLNFYDKKCSGYVEYLELAKEVIERG